MIDAHYVSKSSGLNFVRSDLLSVYTYYRSLVTEGFKYSSFILIHGCNCFHVMGAGVAKVISSKYPCALEADKRTSYGDVSKLGTFSYCTVDTFLTIYNLYTQFNYGRGSLFEVRYLSKALTSLLDGVGPNTLVISPLIGTGRGKGVWSEIEPVFKIFNDSLPETSDLLLVDYDGGKDYTKKSYYKPYS